MPNFDAPRLDWGLHCDEDLPEGFSEVRFRCSFFLSRLVLYILSNVPLLLSIVHIGLRVECLLMRHKYVRIIIRVGCGKFTIP